MPDIQRLPWPDEAPVLPVEPLRPVLERFASLALRHPEDVTLLAPAVDEDGTVQASADPPPALEQIVEEFGGIEVGGGAGLDLLVDERTDLGPYTLLGAATTYYPLHEGEDVAVILTIGPTGAPGAVYGIGEDLSLTLAARDLGALLERYADALTATLDELDDAIVRMSGEAAVADPQARAEAAAELMDAHLFDAILRPDEAAETGEAAEADEQPDRSDAAPRIPVLGLADLADAADLALPAAAIGAADLRDAPIDAVVPVMDAELPGDILEHHLAWAADGLVVVVEDSAR